MHVWPCVSVGVSTGRSGVVVRGGGRGVFGHPSQPQSPAKGRGEGDRGQEVPGLRVTPRPRAGAGFWTESLAVRSPPSPSDQSFARLKLKNLIGEGTETRPDGS